MPSANVGGGQALHESAPIAITHRPQHKMPMIEHQTITQNSNESLHLRFEQNLLKSGIVVLLAEDLIPSISTIANVKDHRLMRFILFFETTR